MIEELKLIVELLKGATDTALYAFMAMGVFKLAKTSLLIFPILGTIKFIFKNLFEVDNHEKNEKTK